MKLAQVCPRFFPDIGGIETHVQEISRRLISSGNELEILTTDASGRLPKHEDIGQIRIRRFRSFAPGDAYFFSNGLWMFLMRHFSDYDLVHAHGYAAFPALYAALGKKKGEHLIFTPHYHGAGHTLLRNLLHQPYLLVAKRIFARSDIVICVSEYEKKLVQSKLQVPEERIRVIPNGLNLSEFKFRPSSKKYPNAVLYVGRLERYKRIDVLIKALKFLDSNITLEVVGRGPDRNRLHTITNNLRLGDRISFSSGLERNELLDKYANSAVFVTLSKHEAYGITVAEALASRTPCVVAHNSALGEWVNNKNCIGVKNANDPADVAKAIQIVKGREIADFPLTDWDEVTRETLQVYNVLLSGKDLSI